MKDNPVLPDYLADPCCFRHGDWSCAVATGKPECYSPSLKGPHVVPMVKSPDLQHWERVGRVLDGKSCGFHSGGCFKNDSYGVDWLEADHVFGPWREVGRERGSQLVRSVPGVIGPGHHSMVTTLAGADYVVCHAWNPAMTDRQMCVDRLDWPCGGPSIERFAPVVAKTGRTA